MSVEKLWDERVCNGYQLQSNCEWLYEKNLGVRMRVIRPVFKRETAQNAD